MFSFSLIDQTLFSFPSGLWLDFQMGNSSSTIYLNLRQNQFLNFLYISIIFVQFKSEKIPSWISPQQSF